MFVSSLVFLALVSYSGTAAEQARPASGQPVLDLAEAEAFLNAFFGGLKTLSGAEAIERVKQRFPVDDLAGMTLGKNIEELTRTLGPLDGYEFVGRVEPVSGRRLASLVYLTYHKGGPAVWEILIYRNAERWQVLKMKFTTDEVLDHLRSLGLTSSRATNVRQSDEGREGKRQ